MTTTTMKLKVKKMEKKEVWAKDIDGEELWKTKLIDPQTGYPEMVITSEEPIEGLTIGSTIEFTLKNPQETLKGKQ